jgi:hypothetical protein
MSDYDTDILTWSERQADLLRRLGAGEAVNAQVDWDNVAEEIESLGRSERSTLASNIRTVIEHLARLEASPAINPRKGWQETILRARDTIERTLESNPSLRQTVGEVIDHEHPRAIRLVARVLEMYGEPPQVPLGNIKYTPEQVCGDWFPPEQQLP